MRARRRGFTLLEVTVVSGLMAFLAVLLSAAWAGIGKTTVDLVARSQLAQEIDVMTAAFSQDFGGNLPTPPGLLAGTRPTGKLLGWRRQTADPLILELCYDSDTSPDGNADWGVPDTVVQYRWDQENHTLIRGKISGGGSSRDFTVARNVDALSFTLDTDNTLHIAVTFGCYFTSDTARSHPIIKRTCKFTIKP
jgi:prepilin-type N-terminal cleavage/methylation domain-containing protein